MRSMCRTSAAAAISLVALGNVLGTALGSSANPFFSCDNVTLRLLLGVAADQPLLPPSELAWRAAGLIVLKLGEESIALENCEYVDDTAGDALLSHGAVLESNGTFTGALDTVDGDVYELFSNGSVAVTCYVDEVRGATLEPGCRWFG